MTKRKIRYDLHATSLSAYIKEDLIPRGLRIQKAPTLFRDNDAFKQKWIAVLNKCSTDLLVLVIEQAIIEANKISVEIESKKKDIMSNMDKDAFTVSLAKLEKDVREYAENIRAFKKQKFARDKDDYAKDRVYLWFDRKSSTEGAGPSGAQKKYKKYDQDTSSMSSSASFSSYSSQPYGLRPLPPRNFPQETKPGRKKKR